MNSGTILIVDDHAEVRNFISSFLEQEGFDTILMCDGLSGLDAALRHVPDLIVLDGRLPDLDGLEVCRRLRATKHTATIPILMVSARGEESDRVVGLEFGADDYLVKPFGKRELVARIKSQLRRSNRCNESRVLRYGRLELDLDRFEVRIEEEAVSSLTHTELRILEHLMASAGCVCPREQIGVAVLDVSPCELGRAVDMHITAIRKKLGSHGIQIETIRGVGYRLRDLPKLQGNNN